MKTNLTEIIKLSNECKSLGYDCDKCKQVELCDDFDSILKNITETTEFFIPEDYTLQFAQQLVENYDSENKITN